MAARAVHKSFRVLADEHTSSSPEGPKPLNAFDRRKYGDLVWFRGEGHRQSGWHLTPGIFRPDLYLKNREGNLEEGGRSPEKWMLMDFRWEGFPDLQNLAEDLKEMWKERVKDICKSKQKRDQDPC